MGKNGAWLHTALETKDRKVKYEIEAIRVNGKISQRSQRAYSCAVIPPASFVEGGTRMPNSDFLTAYEQNHTNFTHASRQ
jgi:hypothetical protein